MNGGAQSDPSGPPPDPRPPGDRVWQHPSEVGLATRGRNDRRRATLLAAGVLLGGIGVLVTGVLLGATNQPDPATTTTTPMERLARSVAHVTVVDDTGTTVVTGLVVDEVGHVLVPADAVQDADEVWARCAEGASELVEVVGTDPGTNLAVLRLHAGAGEAASTTGRTAAGVEVVAVHAKGGTDLAMRSGTLADGRALLTSTSAAAAPVMHAVITNRPEGGHTAVTDDLSGGLMFDRSGRFVGMTTSAGSPSPEDAVDSGARSTSLVTVMPAAAVMDVAEDLIAAS